MVCSSSQRRGSPGVKGQVQEVHYNKSLSPYAFWLASSLQYYHSVCVCVCVCVLLCVCGCVGACLCCVNHLLCAGACDGPAQIPLIAPEAPTQWCSAQVKGQGPTPPPPSGWTRKSVSA